MVIRIAKMIHFLVKTCFIFGAILTGMFFAVVWRTYQLTDVDFRYSSMFTSRNNFGLPSLTSDYSLWLKEQGLRSSVIPEEEISFPSLSQTSRETEAAFLTRKVPILCIVFSKGRKKAQAVKETWGKHCNKVLFFGTYIDNSIPVYRYSSLESSHVYFCQIFFRIRHEVELNNFKWILFSHDSSFVILENARKLVAPLNHHDRYFLGRAIKPSFQDLPTNALDSVIVVSSGSLDFIHQYFFTNESSCRKKDFYFSDQNVTVHVSRDFQNSLATMLSFNLSYRTDDGRPKDTRDKLKRARFLPFPLKSHIAPDGIPAYAPFWRHDIFHPGGLGLACCADSAISFGGVSPSQMYLAEYFLYHFAVFRNSPQLLGNRKPPDIVDKRKFFENEEAWNSLDVGLPFIEQKSQRSRKTTPRKKSLWFNF